jgi:hypothetical protein
MAQIKSPTLTVKGEYKQLMLMVKDFESQIEKNCDRDLDRQTITSSFTFPEYSPTVKIWIKNE